MKMKKLMLIGVVAAALMLASVVNCFAASGWYYCTVQGAGPLSSTQMYFKLTQYTSGDVLFTNKAFYAASGLQKEMLAIALTALANGQKIRIYANPSLSSPTITRMYLCP